MTARSFARLGLIDAFRLYLYPVMTPGKVLFREIGGRTLFENAQSRRFSNGVTLLALSAPVAGEADAPDSFDRLVERP